MDSTSSNVDSSVNTVVAVWVVMAVVGLVFSGVVACCFFKWLHKQRLGGGTLTPLSVTQPAAANVNHTAGSQAYNARPHVQHLEEELLFTGLTVRFTFHDLDTATNGFSRCLGAGGFGAVFEGILKDGNKVAVKRLNGRGNEKDFRAEVETLGTVHHRNVVRLRGYCAEGQHRLLVYDFMSEGSLDSWLFAPRQQQHQSAPSSRSASASIASGQSVAIDMVPTSRFRLRPGRLLPWGFRMQIALGSAKGLAYLHEECVKCIIHLDIKPHNILLDDQLSPKVADFGLAKLMNPDETKVETRPQGTRGYMAPEWVLNTAAGATPKMDVYSLGIVFLELVSGRKVMDPELASLGGLRGWAMELVRLGKDLDVADPRLKGEFDVDPEEVKRMIHIALWCVQWDPTIRPSMREVVQMIEQPQGVITAPLDEHGLSCSLPALVDSDTTSSAKHTPESPWWMATNRSANPLITITTSM